MLLPFSDKLPLFSYRNSSYLEYASKIRPARRRDNPPRPIDCVSSDKTGYDKTVVWMLHAVTIFYSYEASY